MFLQYLCIFSQYLCIYRYILTFSWRFGTASGTIWEPVQEVVSIGKIPVMYLYLYLQLYFYLYLYFIWICICILGETLQVAVQECLSGPIIENFIKQTEWILRLGKSHSCHDVNIDQSNTTVDYFQWKERENVNNLSKETWAWQCVTCYAMGPQY